MPENPLARVEGLGGSAVGLRGWSSTGAHVRGQLVAVAAASLGLTAARLAVQAIRLPFDHEFSAVLFLMWPRQDLGIEAVAVALTLLDLACLLAPLALLGAAVLLPPTTRALPGGVRTLRHYVLLLPLLAFVATTLSRVIGNVLYAAAPWVTWDYTAVIARIEAPLLEGLQRAWSSALLSHICTATYATGWLVALLAAVPLCMARGRHDAAAQVVIGWMASAVVAIPLFLLVPVFEPWAVNAAYGYGGVDASGVRFLGSEVLVAELRDVALNRRWAAAACIPSMHVAIPALASALCFRHGMRGLGWCYAVFTGMVGFSVLYLGRHWIVDVLLGVAYGLAVAPVVVRFTSGFLNLPLPPADPATRSRMGANPRGPRVRRAL